MPTVDVIGPEADRARLGSCLAGPVNGLYRQSIYARVNGYLKKWDVDIGAQVKQGELLAEIEDARDSISRCQVRADLVTAEANAKLAAHHRPSGPRTF